MVKNLVVKTVEVNSLQSLLVGQIRQTIQTLNGTALNFFQQIDVLSQKGFTEKQAHWLN